LKSFGSRDSETKPGTELCLCISDMKPLQKAIELGRSNPMKCWIHHGFEPKSKLLGVEGFPSFLFCIKPLEPVLIAKKPQKIRI